VPVLYFYGFNDTARRTHRMNIQAVIEGSDETHRGTWESRR